MIHRLDLAQGELTSYGLRGTVNQQMLWTLVGVLAFSLVVIFLRDHRLLARYGYVCGLTGLILLAIPAFLPDRYPSRTAPRSGLSCRASQSSRPSCPRSCCSFSSLR